MSFFLKRLRHRIGDHRNWSFLALLPAIIYIAFKALSPDLFYMYQDISLSPGAPVALTTSPTDFEPVSWFVKNQENFFLDTYTLKVLSSQLNQNILLDQKNTQFAPSINNIKQCMSIQCPTNNNTRISYLGKDKALGQMLVDFYAKRLIKKAEEGVKRYDVQSQGAALKEVVQKIPLLKKQSRPSFAAMGDIVIDEQNAFWRQDRLVPVIALIIIGCVLFLCLAAVMELVDPSFKSERQVAAYLQLPLLGTLPNLNKISQYIGGKSSQ